MEKQQEQKILNRTEKLKEKEATLAEEEDTSTKMLTTGDTLLSEATEKLRCAIKANDAAQMAVAQAMIETAGSKLKAAHTEISKTRATQRKVEKKKLSLLEGFVIKKKKNCLRTRVSYIVTSMLI